MNLPIFTSWDTAYTIELSGTRIPYSPKKMNTGDLGQFTTRLTDQVLSHLGDEFYGSIAIGYVVPDRRRKIGELLAFAQKNSIGWYDIHISPVSSQHVATTAFIEQNGLFPSQWEISEKGTQDFWIEHIGRTSPPYFFHQ